MKWSNLRDIETSMSWIKATIFKPLKVNLRSVESNRAHHPYLALEKLMIKWEKVLQGNFRFMQPWTQQINVSRSIKMLSLTMTKWCQSWTLGRNLTTQLAVFMKESALTLLKISCLKLLKQIMASTTIKCHLTTLHQSSKLRIFNLRKAAVSMASFIQIDKATKKIKGRGQSAIRRKENIQEEIKVQNQFSP